MTKEKALGLFNLRLNEALDMDKFGSVDSYVEAKGKILAMALQLHKDLSTDEEPS